MIETKGHDSLCIVSQECLSADRFCDCERVARIRTDEQEQILEALAPVVKWGCAPAMGGGLTDVDGVWASEIFKVIPELEPHVLALFESEEEDD